MYIYIGTTVIIITILLLTSVLYHYRVLYIEYSVVNVTSFLHEEGAFRSIKITSNSGLNTNSMSTGSTEYPKGAVSYHTISISCVLSSFNTVFGEGSTYDNDNIIV